MSQGCRIGRRLQYVVGQAVADSPAFQALAVDDPRRTDGCLTAKLDDSTLWVFDSGSAAVAGPGCLVPTLGLGRFIAASTASGGAGLPKLVSARYGSTGALAAYTRTGNVITKDAPAGALGAIDGVTGTAGDRFFLKDGAAGADNGVYRLDDVGGASRWSMTRVGDADASAEVVAGMVVYTSEGTANGNEWYFLSTNDPIVLNTTALVFTQLPPLTDMVAADSSITVRLSTEESTRSTAVSSEVVARSTPDSSLTIITSSIETRLSTEEATRSTAVSSEVVVRSTADSSITVRVSTVELAALTLLATTTLTSDDLTAVGVGPEQENIGAVLGANDVPMVVRALLSDAFDNGAGVSLNMTIGWNGAADRYVTNFDCYTGSPLESATVWASGTPNAAPQLLFPADSTQMVAAFTAGGDTLANFTNGSVKIEIWGLRHA